MNTPHPSPRLQAAARAGTNSRARLLNPAPGGTETRTDQGVDWGSIKGNIIAVGPGVITRIFRGLQGFGTTVVERLSVPSGGPTEDIYYAGETGAGNPVVHAGEQVQAGQAIAPGLGSGGIEVGYWDSSANAAAAHGHYTEGAVTAEGTAFRNAIGPGGTPAYGGTRPGGGTVDSSGASTGGSAGVVNALKKYSQLRDMPRTAPPDTKNPFQWWFASFSGNWDSLASLPGNDGTSGLTATTGGAATPSGPQKAQVQQVAAQEGISPLTLWGIYGTESDFGRNPSTSSAGAQGPFQFIPSTWKSVTGGKGDIQNFSDSLVAAAKLLKSLGATPNPISAGTVAAANKYNGNGGGSNPSTSYFQSVLRLGKQY